MALAAQRQKPDSHLANSASGAWQVTMMGPSFITHLSSLGSIVTLIADDETEAQSYKVTRT